jgi:hypothetical protein
MNTLKNRIGLFAGLAVLLVLCGFAVNAQTLTSFEKKGKYGFMDETEKVIIEAKYKNVMEFSEGLAAVQVKDKWGFIDKTGQMVIAPEYYEVKSFSDGLAVAKRGVLERYGYINTKGEEALPFDFGSPGSFYKGFATDPAMVEYKMKYGFIDKEGNQVVKPTYEQVTQEGEFWKVVLDGKTGFLDSALNVAVPIEYDVTYSFSEGLIAVNIGGKFNEYYRIEGGKWGFADKQGKLVAPVIYDSVESFNREGKAKVKLNGEEFFINKLGEKIN